MRTKEPSTTIIFVRHGQTDFPTDRIYCDDKIDPALNAAGLKQAEAAAEILANQTLAAIYTSPAQRTRQTAETINQNHNLSIQVDHALVERRFGVWEGLYFDEIEQQFPDEYSQWKQDPIGFTPEGGETIPDVRQRLKNSLQGIASAHRGQTVVVVTHVGPIRVATCEAFQIPIEQYRQLNIHYASLTRVDYGTTKNNLIYLNYTHKHG